MGHKPRGHTASDELAPVIGWTLLIGVLTSAALITVGFVLYLVHGHGGLGTSAPHQLGPVLRGALHGAPMGIVTLGLLVLLVTPVVRVAIGLIGFAREHDGPMTAATAFVLTMLLLGFLLGKVAG